MNNLVATDWLDHHLYADDLVVLDASWHLPTANRDAKAEFEKQHIPRARFFDLDAISEQNTTLPHMLPSAASFTSSMSALGINSDSRVVCYDTVGLFSAARCWWMFKTFGHAKVAVLDGGLRKWCAENRETVSGTMPNPPPGEFTAHLKPEQVCSLDQVATALKSGTAQVADARSAARFRGEEPEPRPGVRPGHMPGARNVHYALLLNPDGTLKSPSELKIVFEKAGVDLAMPIITSCGSGVTAAILSLALTEVGHSSHTLYDGSWAEWGASDQGIAVGDHKVM